jgi:heavy metal sensor kinase
MIKSFRVQITLWYLGLISVLIVFFSFLVYGILSRALESRLDEQLFTEVNSATNVFITEMEEHQGDASPASAGAVARVSQSGNLIAIFEDKRLLAASPEKGRLATVAAQALAMSRLDYPVELRRFGLATAHVVMHRLLIGNRTFLVLAAESLDSVAAERRLLRRIIYFAVPLVLALAGFGGFLLASRKLACLGRMASQAKHITGASLSSRLDPGGSAEEFTVLAASFNELLSRLDSAFDAMRRFTADASHELRTPIAIIRAEADVTLARNRTNAEYKESLEIIQDEARRLSSPVNDLLSLARADSGRTTLQLQEISLNELVADCCRSVQPLADVHQLQLDCNCSLDVSFRGDEAFLRRMVLNLLDNAISYTPSGGKISVALEEQGPELRIRVSDTGTGIAPEIAPHVFDRFYRADKTRSRDEGSGLGLAIVKWIAEAHKGMVELSNRPGGGSTFTVSLPR